MMGSGESAHLGLQGLPCPVPTQRGAFEGQLWSSAVVGALGPAGCSVCRWVLRAWADGVLTATPFLPRRDLSMNNLTELPPGRFRHLRFLEEL